MNAGLLVQDRTEEHDFDATRVGSIRSKENGGSDGRLEWKLSCVRDRRRTVSRMFSGRISIDNGFDVELDVSDVMITEEKRWCEDSQLDFRVRRDEHIK